MEILKINNKKGEKLIFFDAHLNNKKLLELEGINIDRRTNISLEYDSLNNQSLIRDGENIETMDEKMQDEDIYEYLIDIEEDIKRKLRKISHSIEQSIMSSFTGIF